MPQVTKQKSGPMISGKCSGIAPDGNIGIWHLCNQHIEHDEHSQQEEDKVEKNCKPPEDRQSTRKLHNVRNEVTQMLQCNVIITKGIQGKFTMYCCDSQQI